MKKTFLLDLIERAAVLGLYGVLVARIVASISAQGASLGNLLLLPSEGAVLLFVLLRRTTEQVSKRPLDWALAFAATCAPMLVTVSAGRPLIPPAACAAIIVLGTLVQVHAKLVLGRSFGCVPAHRGLKAEGPYRFVRHPMYAGYMLSHAAFALMNPSAWNIGLYVVCAAIQLPRMLAEERILAGDEAYCRYCAAVRHRLIPGIF